VTISHGPGIGFLHTGIEKTCEAKFYQQVVPLTDRIDYLCPMTNNLAYCLAVEKLLGLEIPPKAQWMRVLMNELTRINSHLVWLGTHARTHLSIGLHGAVLPLLLAPCGTFFATHLGVLALLTWGLRWFHVVFVPYALIAPFFLAALAGYYLVWKYVVGFVNRVLGIA